MLAVLGLTTQTAYSQPAAAPNKAVSETSALSLHALAIDPPEPAATDLCDLRISITNTGEHAASRFRFSVSVNGVPLDSYADRVFVEPVLPNETAVIELFRFWVSEKSRPAEPGQELSVEVGLIGAQWVSQGIAPDGVEVSKVLDDLVLLPAVVRRKVSIAAETTP